MLQLARKLLLSTALLAVWPSAGVWAEQKVPQELEPWQMLRSLQYVQDSVILGDHSAAEMQTFLLNALDQRLKSVSREVFRDQRNVDAAMIYAMSGGNPATLDDLAENDIDGNFDSRITDALRRYLNGRGVTAAKTLTDLFPEYRQSVLAPYLALVAGNATAQKSAIAALEFYDWARLTAPGTLIEESALRRSIIVASQTEDMHARGLNYALAYARRFLTSPYAGQFADAFVAIAVKDLDSTARAKVMEVLSFVDVPRRREIYLRIARRAAIMGRHDLAKTASEQAMALSDDASARARTLAELYSGLVGVPFGDIVSSIQRIDAIAPTMLSQRDQALREAARAVAQEVLRKPMADSLTQGADPKAVLQPKIDVAADNEMPQATPAVSKGETMVLDPEFDRFVGQGKSRLDDIDALLKKEQK